MPDPLDGVSPLPANELSVIITPLTVTREGGQSLTNFPFYMIPVGDITTALDISWRVELGAGDHPANANDFYETTGTIHFALGQGSHVFVVNVRGDDTAEYDETFAVVAFDPATGARLGAAEGVIVNDDFEITIAARAPLVREGSGTVQYALFDVTRAGDSSLAQSITWSTAADATDLVAGVVPLGLLTFLPGETVKTISLAIAPDTVLESDKLITVTLFDPEGTPLDDATVRIVNDDATVEVRRVAASDQAEGDSGTTDITFELVVTGDTSIERSVSWMVTEYRESLGTYSVDAADFSGGLFPTGTVTLAPGETHKLFTIPISGDTTSETNEVFEVVLFDPSPGLTIRDGLAWGLITNDDQLPVVAHDDAFVTTEGTWVTPLYSQAPSVLGNDIGATSITLLSGPSHGTVEENVYAFGAGRLTYKPTPGFHGIDTFTYRAIGPDGSDEAQVTIHVVPLIQGQNATLNLLALTPEEQIAATYVAFMGRAADAAGFEFWVDQFHSSLPTQGPKALLSNIASSFAISDEAKELHAFLADPGNASDSQIGSFLSDVYRNLFHRSTDQGGLDYWTGQVRQKLAGGEFVGSVLVDIVSGTQAATNSLFFYNDLKTLMGKVAVSLEFVQAQQAHSMTWNGAADTAAAFNLLKDVYANPDTIMVGIKHGDDYVAAHG